MQRRSLPQLPPRCISICPTAVFGESLPRTYCIRVNSTIVLSRMGDEDLKHIVLKDWHRNRSNFINWTQRERVKWKQAPLTQLLVDALQALLSVNVSLQINLQCSHLAPQRGGIGRRRHHQSLGPQTRPHSKRRRRLMASCRCGVTATGASKIWPHPC